MTCCNHNCDQGRTCPNRQPQFEPCNDACAAGAACPPGSECERKYYPKAPEVTPPYVYIPRWSDDLGNVFLASVLVAVVCVACVVAIAANMGVLR
jgi:hypothetical protein